MSNPDVTILLSTYNGARFLDEQLRSIVAQTHEAWRLVIRDDGSTDDTIEIVQRFCEADQRISLLPVDGVNLGPADSFLGLLAHVDTPYFAFADQDDVWLPLRLANSLHAMRSIEIEGKPCAVFGDAVLIRADGSVVAPSALATRRGARPGRVTFGELLMQNVVMGGTMLGNRALAERGRTIAGRGAPMHDWACALIAKRLGVLKYRQSSDLLHRQHEANVTGRPERARTRWKATSTGGPGGWVERVLGPASSMARACCDALDGNERSPIAALAELSLGSASPAVVVRLWISSARLRPLDRQIALVIFAGRQWRGSGKRRDRSGDRGRRAVPG